MLGLDLGDDTIFPWLPILKHGVHVLLALAPQVLSHRLLRDLFLQVFVGREFDRSPHDHPLSVEQAPVFRPRIAVDRDAELWILPEVANVLPGLSTGA
jgi:hypothetical protein